MLRASSAGHSPPPEFPTGHYSKASGRADTSYVAPTFLFPAFVSLHGRSFPVGVGFGNRVFVCDNLAFIADHVIKRKHTANLKRDLPGVIGELIEPLALHRESQHRTIDRYRHTMLTDMQADHAIMGMYREGIINVQRIADVEKQWREPAFAEFKEERSAWRLFNAATYALTGRMVERPDATPKLHRVIDAVCVN